MLKRWWRLRIFCPWNMYNKPEENLVWKKGQGCAGSAWSNATENPTKEKWKPTIAPKIESGNLNKWAMSPRQIQKTESIEWVVSTPIFKQISGSFVGVMNFDGSQDINKTIAMYNDDQEAFFSVCGEFANQVAYILEDQNII